jgi:regulation of enolase protein 1 (concanavalin A-like superfamily)
VDPAGDCRFERGADKLTITVPGRTGRVAAPALLRDVEGDFAVQVRVGGDFRHAELLGRGVERRAGLLLTDGKRAFSLERVAGVEDLPVSLGQGSKLSLCIRTPHPRLRWCFTNGPPLEKPAYLRLERRGDLLLMAFSQNGEEWTPTWAGSTPLLRLRLPRKLKVGVFAEATAPGPFRAVFDHFKLTPLGGKTR